MNPLHDQTRIMAAVYRAQAEGLGKQIKNIQEQHGIRAARALVFHFLWASAWALVVGVTWQFVVIVVAGSLLLLWPSRFHRHLIKKRNTLLTLATAIESSGSIPEHPGPTHGSKGGPSKEGASWTPQNN